MWKVWQQNEMMLPLASWEKQDSLCLEFDPYRLKWTKGFAATPGLIWKSSWLFVAQKLVESSGNRKVVICIQVTLGFVKASSNKNLLQKKTVGELPKQKHSFIKFS